MSERRPKEDSTVDRWLSSMPTCEEIQDEIEELEGRLRVLRALVPPRPRAVSANGNVLGLMLDVMQREGRPMGPKEVWEALHAEGAEIDIAAVTNSMVYAAKPRGGDRLTRVRRGLYELRSGVFDA